MNTVATILVVLLLSGCGGGDDQANVPPTSTQPPPAAPKPAPQQPTPQPPATSPPPTVAAPFASAGPDQTVKVGQPTTINGNVQPASLPVCWQLLNKPIGSQTVLTQGALSVTLTPDLPGPYVIKLGCGPPQFADISQQYEDEVTITATPIEWVIMHFTAGASEEIRGTITYDPEAPPLDTNVRGLSPNHTFPLHAWHADVAQVFTMHPSTYDNTLPNNTAEFCVGICLFSPKPAVRLFFTSDSDITLEVVFDVIGDATKPPRALGGGSGPNWGGFRQATYRVKNALAPVAVFEVGRIEQVD